MKIFKLYFIHFFLHDPNHFEIVFDFQLKTISMEGEKYSIVVANEIEERQNVFGTEINR